MKKRYYFLGLLAFSFYGCCFPFPLGCDNCYEYRVGKIDLRRQYHIVNHTHNTYTNITLRTLLSMGGIKKWFLVGNEKQGDENFIKISTILPKETIHRGEQGNPLVLDKYNYNKESECYYGYWHNHYGENLFLFSLNGGERKIYFGAYPRSLGNETGNRVSGNPNYEHNDETCTSIPKILPPVFRQKDNYIHIYKDRIEITDKAQTFKIEEVNLLKLDSKNQVSPNILSLVTALTGCEWF